MSQDLFKALGVNVAKEVLSALGPSLLPTILRSRTVGTPDPGDLTAGATISEKSHNCRGFLDTYDSRRFGETTIAQGTRVVVILGASLPTGVVPKPEDRVTIEGSTYVLTGPVVRDPASATYTCEIRG